MLLLLVWSMRGLEPAEQLLEAEKLKPTQHQHLLASQMINIQNALFFSKSLFKIHKRRGGKKLG